MHYYSIKDRVEYRNVLIKHCPTVEMLGGNFTKPLQVTLFRKFRSEIMNIPDDLDMGDMDMTRSGIKRGLCGNCITRLILDSHRSVLDIMIMWEGEIEMRNDPLVGYELIRMIL